MLSPLDDYPIHQVAEPVRHVGTSDRHFYDRYYFNMHPCSDELFLITGMGQYPNLGVADAFVLVARGSQYHVVRASRELGLDRMDTSVGPIRVEVLEGLQRLRVVCEPEDGPVEMDLTWEGSVPAYLEPRHFIRAPHGRVVFDTQRLAQTGCWSGRLRVGDESFDVTPDRWWGSRDRSWGVRPVGEPEPPGISASRPRTFFWNYAPMQFDDHSIVYICQEERDGTRVIEGADRVRAGSDGEVESLGRPEHELEFESGTRNVKRATIRMQEPDGSPLEVTVEPILPVYLGLGTGYGAEGGWRHGMYQGPLKVEAFSIDLQDPDVQAKMFGVVDSVARFEVDGRVGYGLWEYMVLGPHDRYGFEAFDDMAP